ncbi:MAG TPA: hypothetical protein IAB70_02140 [Candidatus Merdicola faecigallinarum]|uniref:Uncharacterized protein n=1 Tax=Candidatus Merdicola faecigallinarum TaxID=2840862 RepID=A0A9D1M0S6_9FIRM|nr:hypothetical protein [Candidatus Merdicola faecigallinarum]
MDNWKYHDQKMKELKQLYLKTSKQTQNRLQEIIDTFKFDFDTLYKIADKKTKDRVNTYITEWKDKGLLTGYFGMLAKNIYSRTRVKNSEILELLVYGAYIEEQNKIQERELDIMYDDANYYYQEGQQEVNNTLSKKERKSLNVLKLALFLALLDQPNVKGYVFEQYIQATIQFNAQQIYRQMTIDLQQQKQPDITNDIYQNVIKRQNNSKLNIKGDKISGDIDAQLIGVNNLAKVEGIKEIDNDAQVRFIAVIDGKETDMCHSLDGQLFYINKENEFNRYYGETQKDLRIEKIKCFGLVTGLNLPPISHHFHWCRSMIQYVSSSVKEENITFDSRGNLIIEGAKILTNKALSKINKTALLSNLKKMEKVFKDFPILKSRNIKYKVTKENDNSAMSIRPTNRKEYILEINENIFNNKIKDTYDLGTKKHDNPKGTSYKDIGVHETGHMVSFEIIKKLNKNNLKAMVFDYNNNITTDKIVEKAFNNLKIRDMMQKEKMINSISNYALTDSSEMIAEAFADYYCNKKKSNTLSKEIVKIMKEMI